MPALDGLAGIVILAIFGSAFVITCGISAIKAIRDRSRLKKHKSRRKHRKDKIESCGKDKENESCITKSSKARQSHLTSENIQSPPSGNIRDTKTSALSKHPFENVDLSVYAISDGIDNLTFHQSDTSIKITDEHNCSYDKSLTDNENMPSCQTDGQKKIKSHEKIFYPDKKTKRLPNDCFVFRQITRRHSYEVAVGENSWLPLESSVCSKTKLDPSNVGEHNEHMKSFGVSFENKAYDEDDFENT